MDSLNKLIHFFDEKLRNNNFESLSAIYQFELLDSAESACYILLKEGIGTVAHGKHPSPDITLQMNENHLEALIEGKLNPTMAFMTGKLKVKGDMLLALKLQSLMSNNS